MACTYCGKEIGPLRLLRDNEFCTSKHRKLYRDRLNKLLGETLTDELPPRSVADFITLLAPRECLPHAFPDLSPRGWIVGNEPPEWHFPLMIDPVVIHRPKRIPFKAVDRPATPRMDDHELEIAQEIEIASPVPPSMLPVTPTLPAAPALPGIPYPAIAAQSHWSDGPQTIPAIGKMIPAAAAPPSFSIAAPRLPAFFTLELNSPLAPGLVIDNCEKVLPFQAADRPATPRVTDQEFAQPIPASVQLTASTLPGIPHPAMAAPANWSAGLEAAPAIGTLVPADAASPSFLVAASRLPACLTLESNAPLALGPVIDSSPKLLPFHAADRPAAPRMIDQEFAQPIPASLQLTASALPGIPHAAMIAPANWSDGLHAVSAMGTMFPAAAPPSFSIATPRLPACLTLEPNSPLALDLDGLAKLLPFQAADRPAAPRIADREIASPVTPSLQLPASALLGISEPAMAAPANWSLGQGATPAIGKILPAGAASVSFSAAAPRLPESLAPEPNSPLALGSVIDTLPQLVPLQAADRPAAPRIVERATAPPITASVLSAAPALPGIPQPAMAAQADWNDGLQAEPAVGEMGPAGPALSFSASAPRLPAFVTLCWDSPLVLGPVIESRLQLLTFHAADRPTTLRTGDRGIAPPISLSLPLTASALPGIPDPAMAAQANWSDGLRAEPAMGKMGLAGAAPPSFSAAAPRLPACLTLEPIQAVQCDEPPQTADFIPLEYYCAAATSGPSVTLEWKWRPPVCALLPFGLHLAAEKFETLTAAKKPGAPFFAPATAVVKKTKWEGRAIQLAAAAVLLVVLTGFAMRFTAGIGTGAADAKPDDVAASTPVVNSGGPLESIRRTIATRAKVELNDSFERGMAAWGHTASWAPGWSRHTEGYVQPGQLALFQPSMKFTDYRMEFFGQIESKSIGWVVRAHDPKNYYAMKFTVIQSGLRPIIAMVHYPVTDGHAGKPIETPLMDVMVHNNTPYHVAVTVAGNRIITSIEGQEVDRWIEDQIPSGGVGFYSDAGERARLYWMKVSKNEDFLGKVCAYLSGSSDASRVFATLLPPRWNYDKR